ncbi:MAG: 2,3-bisphosphoglycerate-independent phosphoglycerate mutase [Candidatus Nanoarchaeia archaeon]
MKNKGVILVIRDGWGARKEKKDNAILSASTPNTDLLMKEYPNTLLNASGQAVGLPKGYQGNSEVGHMTIGSGRIIYQQLERINHSIEKGDFFKIKEFLDAIENCKKNNSYLHLIGLMQKEGVHAHIEHLLALIDLCKRHSFDRVWIHVITDGRDSPVFDSLKNLEVLNEKIKNTKMKIATVSGRYYAMDRDNRWDRTKKAYDSIVLGNAESFDSAKSAIESSHKNKITDEFIIPVKFKDYPGIKPKDSIIFSNFRTDRTRQLTKAIVEKNFEGWKRTPLDVFFVAMTQFYTPMNTLVAFKDQKLTNLLGEVISQAGLRQLRISETEKYAHVTFFFNCQKEEQFKEEDRILIPSPKVATYDLKPEMSVYEIGKTLVEKIKEKKYDFIVTNLVNCDMVGHTGNIEAIKKAIEAVDNVVGKIYEAAKDDYNILIFADHGNAEDQTPEWRTSHTINPVPFILVSQDKNLKNAKLKKGLGLKDIAPTVLDLLNIKKPKEMSGEKLIER